MPMLAGIVYTFMVGLLCEAFSAKLDNKKVNCPKAWGSYDRPICLPKDYQNDVSPFKNDTLNVTIVTIFENIIEVDDADATITFSMEFCISWADPRVKLNLNSSTWNQDDIKWLGLNTKWLDYVWKPDIDVVNIVRFKVKKIFDNQASLDFYEDGTFWYRVSVDVTLNCPLFDYQAYPLDEQVCKLFIGSYGYDQTKAMYKGHFSYHKGKQRPLQYKVKELQLLSFNDGLLNYDEYSHMQNGSFDFEVVTYSHFAVRLVLARLLQPHLMCTYLPSFLIVVCSWLGFLIDPDSVPGRIALSVTLLLVLINMR